MAPLYKHTRLFDYWSINLFNKWLKYFDKQGSCGTYIVVRVTGKKEKKSTVANYNNSLEENKGPMNYRVRTYIRKNGQGESHEDIALKKEREWASYVEICSKYILDIEDSMRKSMG